MPLYEYRCEACGELEEKLEGFAAPTEHACDKCGAGAGMKRQISRAAFTLSGGGWHAQGYSGPAPEKKTSEATPPPAAPAGGCSGCPCAAKDS